MSLPNYYDEWRTAYEPAYPKIHGKCKCEDCDNPIFEHEYYFKVDGFNYCSNCMERNYKDYTDGDEVCAECGEIIIFDDPAFFIHERWICESCMREFEEK